MLKVKKTNFYDFFTKGNFVIPNYQRGYVWAKNEWENFYNDVKNRKTLSPARKYTLMNDVNIKIRQIQLAKIAVDLWRL